MESERGRQALLAVLGVTGVATGVWLFRRKSADRRPGAGPRTEPHGPARDVAESLRRDADLSRRAIDVGVITDGVVELDGSVQSRDEASRAVRIAQGTPGVYTVVNRLVVEEEESQRESTRRRWNDGAPELRERHHYGMGVGMGTRRQSPTTDPDRPSDRQRMIERELEVGNVVEDPEADAAPDAGSEGVESEPAKPGDLAAIEEAGLDPDAGPAATSAEAVEVDSEEEVRAPAPERER